MRTESNQGITAELTLPSGLVDTIADRVAEKLFAKLKPYLEAKPKHDELLTVSQVAELLGKSKEQVYQWVNDSKHALGTFPYKKAGRSLRFSKNEVMGWLNDNKNR